MAAHTITFSVTSTEITVTPSEQSTVAGDKISFATNQAVYLQFKPQKWPFTETEPAAPISVPTTGCGPYTVHAKAGSTINKDGFKVGTELDVNGKVAGITTSAEIDIS